jgi:hypothetical protein
MENMGYMDKISTKVTARWTRYYVGDAVDISALGFFKWVQVREN